METNRSGQAGAALRWDGVGRALGIASSVMVLAALLATPAAAYMTREAGGCDPITFAAPPRVVVHAPGMEGFDPASMLQFLLALTEIHQSLDDVGASSASVAGLESSSEPLVYGTWFGDAEPTIHVGFTSSSAAAQGSTTWDISNDGACHILEAHIEFQDLTLTAWRFGEPEAHGEVYYLAEHDLITSPYFRISYLHELLHAFGLAHSNSSYSMMNYGTRPFANRAGGGKVMPLPDDVEALRDLYPAAGSRRDLAVLNTWYEPDATSASTYPAANHQSLCKPSAGSTWDSMFGEYCAIDPTTEVCPGDNLLTRVAVANYGTESLGIEEKVWFSLDDQFSGGGADTASSTVRTFTLGAQSSSQQGRVFEVPRGLDFGTDYFVIVRLRGTTAGGASVSDWIPLRGTIRTKPRPACRR